MFRPLASRTCITLFLHPQLQELELHWAEATLEFIPAVFALYFGGSLTTQLRDLEFVDCRCSSDDLATLLRLPCALRTLSICSDLDANMLDYDAEVDHELYFRAISENLLGKSLEGFKVDFLSRAWITVPAPRMDRLQEGKYPEVNSAHLVYKAGEVESNEFRIPQIDCPLNRLLPPKLEVLKVTLYEREDDEEFILNILEQKPTLVPFLRTIILANHYRDEKMAQELKDAVAKEEDGRSYAGALDVITRGYPVYTDKESMNAVEVHCKRSGAELMLLYEDSATKEILREGAGPPFGSTRAD
ncbi:hypothetical protein BDZ45DRAFT_184902 [Acephala macrosclerotiorum]|nr:hypothetical protein BDZ45DRAFT_184902 [Acephala macrosclerotiorum]